MSEQDPSQNYGPASKQIVDSTGREIKNKRRNLTKEGTDNKTFLKLVALGILIYAIAHLSDIVEFFNK